METSFNMDIYLPTILLVLLAILMVFGALVVGKFLRPANPSKLKLTAYECGEAPVGVAWTNFNVRFYVIALVFIVFDVESALMFPVVAVYKKFIEMGAGTAVLLSLVIFILVLVQGVIYCWKKGDLDWVKSYRMPKDTLKGR